MKNLVAGINVCSVFLALWAWSRFVRVLPTANTELWKSLGRPEPGIFGWRKRGLSLKGAAYLISRNYRNSGDLQLERWGSIGFWSIASWAFTFLLLALLT